MSETLTDLRPQPVEASLWSTYRTLLRWNMSQIGAILPLVIVVQALLAAGVVIGFGLIIPGIDQATALHLSTGTPTVLLLITGFVLVPQGVARNRADGTFDYMRSLPIARPLLLAAELTVWLIVAAPSVAVGVLVASLRYDLPLSVDWPVLLTASLLVTIMATSVGYAIAVTLRPMAAQLLSQVLVFFILLFSPVTFPASQLPQWYQMLHDALPIRPGADLLRAGLTGDPASGLDLVVLTAWTALGVAVTLRALVRRG